jgi:hypothetical protein
MTTSTEASGLRGVVFPETEGQQRSTSRLGRAVVADALRSTDPIGARSAEQETSWRRNYLLHFRRLVEAGLLSPDAARSIARDGLRSLHERMRYVDAGNAAAGEVPLTSAFDREPHQLPSTATISGKAEPERELSLPFHGERLRGDALLRQLDAWVQAGSIEPSCAEAVRQVVAHPEWLDLRGDTVVVLGAGAEMGPLQALLRWGGNVVGVDLPRPDIWRRLTGIAERCAGALQMPVPAGDLPADPSAVAGLDLLHELPTVARWLQELPTGGGRLVLGNYVYADGANNLRVAMAVDALTTHVQQERPDAALALLATPTDVFAVPADAVAHATREYESRGLIRRPLKVLSGGRLLRRNYPPDADPGINDSLVAQQGPNYALAKRLQRWRATVARHDGAAVSFHVAPPTRTRSVLKNRALAAAYAGAHRFGIEVFEPATSNTLMAALLVHDLRADPVRHEHPWQDEAFAAAHGGLWRAAYAPRSALGLAVVLGVGGARG